MILPDDLVPLPVGPRTDDPAGVSHMIPDDFVSAGDVRRVLLGAKGELPVEGLSSHDFDSFAGRSDVPYPSRSPFVAGRREQEPELLVPEMVVEPRTFHPAFEVLPPARRAAPPRVTPAVDCEAGYGQSRFSDHWWVMGMGLAAAAILFSGTLANFVYRETLRRSSSDQPEVVEAVPAAPESAARGSEEKPETLAASIHPGETR